VDEVTQEAERARSAFSFLNADLGRIGLASVEREIAKDRRARGAG
jgi:hypothetical protein